MKIQSILYIASIGLLITGCKREDIASRMEGQSVAGQANVKIIHASAYATNYSVQLKVNGVRVSNNITNSTAFPGGGINVGGASSPWYMALTPGQATISLSIAKTGTQLDSVTLFTGNTNLVADKYYSAYLTDTANNTQMVVVNDDTTLPAINTSRYRFINLMPNQPSLDLYWGTNKVASNIAYKSTSPDFLLTKADTARWYIRPAGAAPASAPIALHPAIAPTFVASLTIPNQRVLTVFARGYSGGSGNRIPNVSLLYNH